MKIYFFLPLNNTGCNPKDLLLMNNATTAINTVVQNIDIQKGDRVYCLNVTYGKNQKSKKHALDMQYMPT